MKSWALSSLNFVPKRHSFGGPGPWSGHLPFAHDLLIATRPPLIVELGTFYGESYFGFCQTVVEKAIAARCYAIDTWKGDAHGGTYGEEIYADVEAYNDAHYAGFSYLIRSTFDEALSSFSDGTVDLLHIDGFHSYDAVRHDFESWYQKVRPGGIILLHDICVRLSGFGVWRFWEELCERFRHFAFPHSAGLGLIIKEPFKPDGGFVCDLVSADLTEQAEIARFYFTAASRLRVCHENAELRKQSTSPMLCPVQVFFALENDYTEEHSTTRVIEFQTWQQIGFNLPAGTGTRPVRIDPCDRASIIEISEISLFSEKHTALLWKWAPGDGMNLASAGTVRILDVAGTFVLLSEGNDPQLYLPELSDVPRGAAVELEVTLRVTPCVPVNDRLIPVGEVANQYGMRPELSRAFLHDELRSSFAEILRLLTLKIDDDSRHWGRIDRVEALLGELHSLSATLVDQSAQELTHARLVGQHLGAIREELARTPEVFNSLITRLIDAEAGIAELRGQLEDERRRREDLLNSWSWRGTAPLRAIADMLLGLGFRKPNHS